MSAPALPDRGDHVRDRRDGSLAVVIDAVDRRPHFAPVVEVRYVSSGQRTSMSVETFERRFEVSR